jgi:hypothetical protein
MPSVSANFLTNLTATVDIGGGRTRFVSAGFVTEAVAVVTLSNVADRRVSASFATGMTATVALSGGSDRRGRTLCELVGESLSLWGFLCAKTAPRYAVDRAITDINSALQLVWNNADERDYWTNETVTLTFDDGESEAGLPDEVQNVVGTCRRADTNRPLTPVGTVGELESFADLYLDGETLTEPVAYHIERTKQSGVDPARCVLHITPAAVGEVEIKVEVVKEAPRYTMDDLGDCPLVPIPHQYAETLLIPIIRYNASSYYLFKALDPAQKETIDREYQQAMISLGLADPNPVKKGGAES